MENRINTCFLRAALLCVAAVALANCAGGVTVGPGPSPGRTQTPVTPAPGTTSTPAPGATGTPTPVATSTSTAVSSNAADGIPFPAATDPDAFYAQPSPFPNFPHGTILTWRTITFAPNNTAQSN